MTEEPIADFMANWVAPPDCTYPSCAPIEHAKQEWEATADSMPQVICLLDAEGQIIRVNRSVERWGLCSVNEAKGRYLHDLFHPGCSAPECYLKGFVDGLQSAPRRGMESHCQAMDPALDRHLEFRYFSRQGNTRPELLPDHSVVVISDISEIKVAEEALHRLTQELEQRVEIRTAQLAETNRRLRQEMLDRHMAQDELQRSRISYQRLVESMHEGLVVRDRNDRITYVNRSMARMLGHDPEDIQGRPVLDMLAETSPASWAERTQQRRMGDTTPFDMLLKPNNGRQLWARISPQPIFAEDGEYAGSFAVITDITEDVQSERALKASQQELRELSAQVHTAQEMERKRIASELHDGLGQTLSAIKFSIENLIGQVNEHRPEECQPQLQAMVPKLQRAIEEVRRISMALRPSILDDLGILATLRWFCREFQADYQAIKVGLETDASETGIPSAIKLVIFRIVQEALNNAAKYSTAAHLRVRLVHDGRGLELEVSDDGIGFDPSLVGLRRKHDSGGMGLVSMRERAEYLGGEFSLHSRSGEGTSIKVFWPNSA